MRPLKRGSVRVLVDVVREPSTLPGAFTDKPLCHARHVAELLLAFREAQRLPSQKEAFLCLSLDTRHRPLAVDLVSLGSLQSSVVHPREVFRPAVALGAAAIIIAHNHPSGEVHPSAEDEAVTDRLREAGRILGIPLLDHLILGSGRFYCFAEERKFDLEP